MTGTSGHELGQLGAAANFADLAARGVAPGNTRLWLHLGSSLATAEKHGGAFSVRCVWSFRHRTLEKDWQSLVDLSESGADIPKRIVTP